MRHLILCLFAGLGIITTLLVIFASIVWAAVAWDDYKRDTKPEPPNWVCRVVGMLAVGIVWVVYRGFCGWWWVRGLFKREVE